MDLQEIAKKYDALAEKRDRSADDIPRDGAAIHLMNYETQGTKICEKALDQDPQEFIYVHNKTSKLTKIAVANDLSNLLYVQQSEELCELAIKSHGAMALTHVHRKTPKLIEQALKLDGMLIAIIKNQEEAYQKLAVQQNPLALQFIHNPTASVCMLAVQENEAALRFVPKSIINQWR